MPYVFLHRRIQLQAGGQTSLLTTSCIWQKLNAKTIKKTCGGTGKGYYVHVPVNQEFLNEMSNTHLLTFTNLPEHMTNYNFLLSQKKFMQIIKAGGIVKLHSKEWVNKCSGRGEIELIVDDGNTIKTRFTVCAAMR